MFVVLLNFAVHFFLLLGTAQMLGQKGRITRFLLSAAVWAGYSGLCMMFGALGKNAAGRLLVLVVSACIAFGTGQEGRKPAAVFLLACLALDGAAAVLGRDGVLPLAVTGCLLWILCSVSHGFEKTVPVEIEGEYGSVQLVALRDTGNALRDPITGESVLVVGAAAAESLLGLTREQLHNPLETMRSCTNVGLRLIPYSSVGVNSGLLLAKRFQRVRIGSRVRTHLVAFAPQTIGGEAYQALAGGME